MASFLIIRLRTIIIISKLRIILALHLMNEDASTKDYLLEKRKTTFDSFRYAYQSKSVTHKTRINLFFVNKSPVIREPATSIVHKLSVPLFSGTGLVRPEDVGNAKRTGMLYNDLELCIT